MLSSHVLAVALLRPTIQLHGQQDIIKDAFVWGSVLMKWQITMFPVFAVCASQTCFSQGGQWVTDNEENAARPHYCCLQASLSKHVKAACVCVSLAEIWPHTRQVWWLSSYSRVITCAACQYCYCLDTQVNVYYRVCHFSLRWYVVLKWDRLRHPHLICTNSSSRVSSLRDATNSITTTGVRAVLSFSEPTLSCLA